MEILQTTLSNAYFLMKIFVFSFKLVLSLFLKSNWQEVVIDSDNGLSPIRRQAITWTNADQASVPLSGLRSNSKCDKNLECSGSKCAQSTTTKHFVGNRRICYELKHDKSSLNFECDRNIVCGTGAASLTHVYHFDLSEVFYTFTDNRSKSRRPNTRRLLISMV